MSKQKTKEDVIETKNKETKADVQPQVDTPTDLIETEAHEEVLPKEAGEAEAEIEAAVKETGEEVEVALEDELESARQEAAKNLENWQRTAAELANYKRRQEEQRKLLRDRIKTEVLQGVISALDDMDLAFQNLPDDLDGQLIGWVEGFRLVQRKLDRILDEQNVMLVDTKGKFDPNFHEAVSYEDSDDHQEGDIIAEMRKGYQIGSRVIRPALVRVAK